MAVLLSGTSVMQQRTDQIFRTKKVWHFIGLKKALVVFIWQTQNRLQQEDRNPLLPLLPRRRHAREKAPVSSFSNSQTHTVCPLGVRESITHPVIKKQGTVARRLTDHCIREHWEDWQVSHGIHFGLNFHFACSIIFWCLYALLQKKNIFKIRGDSASRFWASHACGVLHGPHLWLLRYLPQYIRSTQDFFYKQVWH